MESENSNVDPESRDKSSAATLPPVSPPSPGFIMQLFVIPLIVVSVIVGVWLLVHWAVNRDMRPAELAKDIERLNHASWQQALTLANQLRDDKSNQLRSDAELCRKLASQLQRHLEEGSNHQENVWLRMYLCRALGEFQLPDGLPALTAAAMHQQHMSDIEVQRAALQAIIYLKDRLAQPSDWNHPQLLDAAKQAAITQPADDAEDHSPLSPEQLSSRQLRIDRLHSTAAVLLGLIPDSHAIEPLVELMNDKSVDVRYNAAFALARHGDARCEPVLIEMLDLDRPNVAEPNVAIKEGKITEDELVQWNQAKREMILLSGLRGAQLLSEAAAGRPLDAIQSAVTRVTDSKELSPELIRQARIILRQLEGADPVKETSTPRAPRRDAEVFATRLTSQPDSRHHRNLATN